MAILYCEVNVILREIILKNKPEPMLKLSPKGTVPVLVLSDGTVMDESLEIMKWALENHAPDPWLSRYDGQLRLIKKNDEHFKPILDLYKYADRFPEQTPQFYRQQGEVFLQELEQRLTQNVFLLSNKEQLADVAIFPFIRQFAQVDIGWFEQEDYPKLQHWLSYFTHSALFLNSMKKYPVWQEGNDICIFP